MPLSDEFWQNEEEAIWSAVVAIYLSTLMQGVEGGIALLPPELRPLVDIDAINADVLEQANRFRDGVVLSIMRTTREQADAVYDEWLETGGGDLGVLDALLAPIFSEARAEMIATTEVTRAFQNGNDLVWLATGYIQFHQWNTQRDERVCPICGPKDGNIYVIGGEAPPAHPRCRCWVSPVVRLT